MNASTHKYYILKKLYETELRLTATDFSYVSNANQYFVELENQELLTSAWGKKGKSRVKLRFIAEHQKIKAKKYLDGMQGIREKISKEV
jgi:hypothetical protein